MKYILIGILPGALAGLMLFTVNPAMEIEPAWRIPLAAVSGGGLRNQTSYALIPDTEGFIRVAFDGSIASRYRAENLLVAPSGDGKFYATYRKAGTEVEFFNSAGELFWKIFSREYPWLSGRGALVFLVTGDHSRVRVMTKNGSLAPGGEIHGRLLTAYAFDTEGDGAAFGFLDGSIVIISGDGAVAVRMGTPNRFPVKSLAIRGSLTAVHYGTPEEDGILRIEREGGSPVTRNIALKSSYTSKRTMHFTPRGDLLFLAHDGVYLFDRRLKNRMAVKLSDVDHGHASIDSQEEFFTLGYRDASRGTAVMVFCNYLGEIFYRVAFPGEERLFLVVREKRLVAGGTESLYGYIFSMPDPQ